MCNPHSKSWMKSVIIIAIAFVIAFAPISAYAQSDFLSSDSFVKNLDYDWSTIHSVTVHGEHYQIKQVTNYISPISGIEVFDSSGNKITNNSLLRQIFDQAGWIESVKSYSQSDINTLKNILLFSNEISSTITPINSDISNIMKVVDTLQNDLCVDLVVFRGCAWDLVEYQIPGITILSSVVKTINNELTEWSEVTNTIRNNLPKTIKTIEDLKYDHKISPSIENDIQNGISSLTALKRQADDFSSDLSEINQYVRVLESGLNEGSDFPLIGNTIYKSAQFFGNLAHNIDSLRQDITQISGTASNQVSKLNQLISDADRKTNEYHNSWNARQSALEYWGFILLGAGIVILLLIILIPIAVVKKKKTTSPKKGVTYKKYCRKCGSSLSQTVKYCRKCGTLS